MKVFLLGATGNLGSRLVPALLTHGHTVVAFVRSHSKLEHILPPSTFEEITVVEGDATNTKAVKEAILATNCDAVVTAAGVAAMAPWGKSDLPKIFRSVRDAVWQASEERGSALRVWFMAGIPMYPEHRGNLTLLEEMPANAIEWSMLCPMTMNPESSDLSVPTKLSQGRLTASATVPPMWKRFWFSSLPLVGSFLAVAMNAGRYSVTTLEQNADLIATDLETRHSQFVGKTVGVISVGK
ncbi:hypothetical protein LTR62_001513 [Meristemomyces frigidus]|uniref:NAD(P)-binding domain-containing protein n=1 Tax=Meristemomyces frigidus TaxID=1508187 RepID=A0AAN7YLQ8_9PEZI|nr:hypothetical protein LTR62_001513 [Meristemomyces frigidus]